LTQTKLLLDGSFAVIAVNAPADALPLKNDEDEFPGLGGDVGKKKKKDKKKGNPVSLNEFLADAPGGSVRFRCLTNTCRDIAAQPLPFQA